MRNTQKIIVWLCALVAVFLSACQPTPESPLVVNKTKLEGQLVQSPDIKERYHAPTSWQEDIIFDEGSLTILVDATVQVPDADAFPVVAVSPMQISQAQADRAINYFFQGEPCINPNI